MTATDKTVATYAVLIEAREMRTAFGLSLADAVDDVRGKDSWGNNPHDCEVTVRYFDGREMISVDTNALARPFVSRETMREKLIAIARKELPKLPEPCPPGMSVAKATWKRWVTDGPTEHDIQSHQAGRSEWLPREEIEAYEREHIPQ